LKIDAMILREDFYKISDATLERYFREVEGKEVHVKTVKHGLRNCLVVYPHLGAITTRWPGYETLKFLLSEYNIRNKPIKNLLAKAYVLFCLFTFGLFSQCCVHLTGNIEIERSMLIFPANRKLRIYNFKTGYVDAIVKESFTLKYFQTELSFRLENHFEFVPQIADSGEGWYREVILPGQPLARIREEILYRKCLGDTVKHMNTIIQAGEIKYVDAKEYADNLYRDICEKMEIARQKKHIRSYEGVLEIAGKAYEKAGGLGEKVPVAPSHGDLQSGNVWVDAASEKTYIIDWETYGWRSVWYDCATILLSTRRAGKLKEMMENRDTNFVKEALFQNDKNKDYKMESVIAIIVMEDILFYLEDMLELPEAYGADIFDRIAGEFGMMGWGNSNGYQI